MRCAKYIITMMMKNELCKIYYKFWLCKIYYKNDDEKWDVQNILYFGSTFGASLINEIEKYHFYFSAKTCGFEKNHPTKQWRKKTHFQLYPKNVWVWKKSRGNPLMQNRNGVNPEFWTHLETKKYRLWCKIDPLKSFIPLVQLRTGEENHIFIYVNRIEICRSGIRGPKRQSQSPLTKSIYLLTT